MIHVNFSHFFPHFIFLSYIQKNYSVGLFTVYTKLFLIQKYIRESFSYQCTLIFLILRHLSIGILIYR